MFGLMTTAIFRVFILSLAFACTHSSNSNTPADGGVSDGGGGKTDGGADAGPSCTDAACGANRYCGSSGTCLAAKACTSQSDCEYQPDPAHPDYCDSQGCFCDPADSVCRPRHAFCMPCARDVECGNITVAFDTPGACGTVGSGKFCLPVKAGGGCPRGYIATSDAACQPGSGSCSSVAACSKDTECDPASARPICDIARGLCSEACDFDLKTGASNCPAGGVCHLDPRFTTAGVPNYNRGKCGSPCTSTSCPSSETCRSEGQDNPVLRCTLPEGQCLGDVECPAGTAENSKGYCDTSAHACKTDCRPPPANDCALGYGCQSGKCVKLGCDAAGGANSDCTCGQLCCGENGAPACPSGTAHGACYDMPQEQWDATCASDDDCNKDPLPKRNNKNLCLQVSPTQTYCFVGCDLAAPPGQCPSRFHCGPILAQCQVASDCAPGVTCAAPDKAHPDQLSCDCSSGGCPTGTQCVSYLGGKWCAASTVCMRAACAK